MVKVLVVEGETLPEVWEKSILAVWSEGVEIETEYGGKSKDCTMLMIVKEPLREPRIHKAGIYGNLGEYVREVLEGIHDSYVDEGKWPYTYHERLFRYRVGSKEFNQIEYIIKKLRDAPHTRRAQAITWKPWIDYRIDDPPCLQRVWFRVFENELVLESMWRSRDALKAAFMNMFALTEMQKVVAEELGVKVGCYVDFSNSYHIYERDYEFVRRHLLALKQRRDRFLTTSQARKFRIL